MKVLLSLLVSCCWAGGCTGNLNACQHKEPDVNSVEAILRQLSRKTKELKSYHCRLEYLFSQPLFDSQTLRKGELYYEKDPNSSILRIDFNTIKQDDEPQEQHKEQYLFDGTRLTRIDYQLKEVKVHQLLDPNEIDPNKPADAFDLISENFPIIGFTQTDKLKEQFEIKLIEDRQPVIPAKAGIQKFIHLHLKVKPESIYKDDYTSIDFWIDKKQYLPAKIVAFSTEEEIYQLKFLEPKVNEKIDEKIFDLNIPEDFPKPEIIPLKE